tara:strand:+ start:57 stop:989 length:933 start_codon:yes stop_codon:yes gene_type:complete
MTTIVFPGQGSQYVGMARDFYENFSSAKEVFDIVEDSTKIRVKQIIFENNENLLDITKYTQICIYTASMAIFNVFKELISDKTFLDLKFVLGHSLGEYSALTASNTFDIFTCSELLKIRGDLMQNAFKENQSGMAAVIGLNCASLEKIIKENSINVEIANDNTPNQVVISGIIEDIKSSEEILINNGAKKIIILNVSAAFHSKIMKKAEEKMHNYLSKIKFNDPIYSVISNFSGKDSKDKSIIYESLSKQMSNRVKWVDSIKNLLLKKEKNIIEIGPGQVLTGIIKRISNEFNHYNLNEIKDIEILKNEL